MTKRMLIDATHAEETRVVVLDGNRLEDFDVETQAKRQLKGNIYLAKVVRVEPSLQAAFVEYGGGRHGFLAFGEIHPDYYQIPVADRQRLLEIAAEEAREEEEAEERREAGWAVRAEAPGRRRSPEPQIQPDVEPEGPELPDTVETPETAEHSESSQEPAHPTTEDAAAHEPTEAAAPAPETPIEQAVAPTDHPAPAEASETLAEPPHAGPAQPAIIPSETVYGDAEAEPTHTGDVVADDDALPTHHAEAHAEPAHGDEPQPNVQHAGDADGISQDDAQDQVEDPTPTTAEDRENIEELAEADATPPETVGGESDQFEGNGAEEASRRRSSRMLRSYRIQEVIRRRQILLIQVVKEERGNKGAALTTYISLAGRYCVLMPNSPRGGGISRKITSAADRKRLKEITAEMEIPKGMGLIVRTAGAARPKPEIRRDCEYLMRLWDDIRDHTMRSMAPALIYEEASLIKRSIRDVYSRDVDEIIVDGEEGWKQAHDFMRMLMPSHAKKVQLWRPQGVATPLFAKHQVDLQLDAMLSPVVQLKSGGYLVINQTEALVAIDVNSGRSTRERGIEETALKTNLEAADELARQLRLRDLAGLIVIDFIDMEIRRSNAAVERRMKEALKNDRARIQIGAITHFGLMEMSRQRLRPSLAETSFVTCPHCTGLGLVRSVESAAIHVLRSVEEEGSKLRAAAILVHAATPVVMYLLNNKRERLSEIEARYAMRISFAGDDTLLPPAVRIDKLRAQVADAERLLAAAPVAVAARPMDDFDDEDAEDLVHDEEPETAAAPAPRPAREDRPRSQTSAGHAAASQASSPDEAPTDAAADAATAEEGDVRRKRRRRRRGRRDPASGDSTAAPDGTSSDNEEDGEDGPTTETAAGETESLNPPDGSVEGQAAGEGAPVPVEFDENGDALPPAGGARRRGRRGGRRRRRGEGETSEEATAPAEDEAAPEAPDVSVPPAAAPLLPTPAPAYAGPTPANPFNNTYDIFDMLEQAEEAAAQPVAKPAPEAAPPPVEPAPTPVETKVEAEAIPLAEPEPEPETPPQPAKRGWWRR